jgi:integrase
VEACEAVIAKKAKELQNAKHLDQWRNTLASYAAPVFGRRKVSDITRDDVLRALEPIWIDKTETATRLRGRIEYVLDWATVAGQRTGDNPAMWKGGLEHLLPSPSNVATKGHHPALAVGDATRWWYEMPFADGLAARALQFLALTWARSGEVRGATWSEIDLDRGVWIIPASRMKAEREHWVPLSPVAV